ncbi:MAG: NADH:flavin oxidoreductase/NADH oxidase [Alphaproteobacteria bacterium]|nr:NADH:flavin oxidoreductase/NADH oxidase [Alphaproteobacteria bacterium]
MTGSAALSQKPTRRTFPRERNPRLFQPISFRSVTARNRLAIAPMCQYSAVEGVPGDWHMQHLGARAVGGAGIVCVEATGTTPEGRISPGCTGLWNDTQVAAFARINAFMESVGAVPAIQLSHAGRKASARASWLGGAPLTPAEGGWHPIGATAEPFAEGWPAPQALDRAGIARLVDSFGAAAARALKAGFKIIELHGAHGYLIHTFLSPISNTRSDAWGGDLKGRARFLMELLDSVRAHWPAELPLFVRLSCVDWIAGGLTIADSVELCRWLKARGDVDLIDCSSGGVSPRQVIPSLHPGYQVPFAEAVRREAGIATGAVGLIQTGHQAADIIGNERADLVFIARAALANPNWPLAAAREIGADIDWPVQYERANLT